MAGIPVIFWTAHYHEREALALAGSCGVLNVITKPAEPEAVLNAVAAALGGAKADEVPLTPAEFGRKHVRLLTNQLSHKANDLFDTNARLSALVELNLQVGSELDLRRLIQCLAHSSREIIGARYSIAGILDESGTRAFNR